MQKAAPVRRFPRQRKPPFWCERDAVFVFWSRWFEDAQLKWDENLKVNWTRLCTWTNPVKGVTCQYTSTTKNACDCLVNYRDFVPSQCITDLWLARSPSIPLKQYCKPCVSSSFYLVIGLTCRRTFKSFCLVTCHTICSVKLWTNRH